MRCRKQFCTLELVVYPRWIGQVQRTRQHAAFDNGFHVLEIGRSRSLDLLYKGSYHEFSTLARPFTGRLRVDDKSAGGQETIGLQKCMQR